MDIRASHVNAQNSVSSTGWSIVQGAGSAAEFHHRDPLPTTQSSGPSRFEHQVWIHRIDRPAVVLGSGQRTSTGAHAAGGHEVTADAVELCRRRSGGGVVYVDPTTDVWIDLIVPSWSSLWDDDIARSFHWLGDVWAGVLNGLVDRPDDSDEPMFSVARPTRSLPRAERGFFCFADVGHGEVMAGTAKVVGVSQRRTRDWARFQSLMVGRWDPDSIERALSTTLGLGPHLRAHLGASPHDAVAVTAGLPRSVDVPRLDDVVATFLVALPRVVEQ